MSLVRAERLSKTYRVGDIDVPAIKGVDFAIEPASFVGPSGSGKSTLLNMIGCLDHPTSRQKHGGRPCLMCSALPAATFPATAGAPC